MAFPDWVEDIAAEASRPFVEGFLGRERVLYLEQFEGPTLSPSVDFFVRGPLQLGDSGNVSPPLTTLPAPGVAPQPVGGCLRLEINGAQSGPPVSSSLSISPFPTGIQVLRVTATFRTVPTVAPLPGPWAASVYVREGGVTDSALPPQRISATMRVNDGAARLNTPGNNLTAALGLSPDRLPLLFPASAVSGVEFTLELLLDLAGGSYYAYLSTSGGVDERLIEHGALPSLWPATSVGFALARGIETGHQAIDVRSFKVSGILEPGLWGRTLGDWLSVARRAILPRFVPPSPHRRFD
ncbi:MAG: hypothetical protein SFU84_11295 [Gemmatimonadales bacterium]|nr:hypothetical protein [Gemmatimonadales bacterium]